MTHRDIKPRTAKELGLIPAYNHGRRVWVQLRSPDGHERTRYTLSSGLDCWDWWSTVYAARIALTRTDSDWSDAVNAIRSEEH